MPLLGGLLAMLLAFATFGWMWRGLFASGGGLFLALGCAHAIGTTVAAVIALGSQRTLRTVCHAVARAILGTLVLLIVTVAAYAVMAYAMPRLFGSLVGLVASALVAHAVCAVATSRLDPAWTRTAGSLWLAIVILMTAYLFTISRQGP